jgi:hypothetical protein
MVVLRTLGKAFVDYYSSTGLPRSQLYVRGMEALGESYRLAILVVMFELLDGQQTPLERVEARVEIGRSMVDVLNWDLCLL